jgi:DegV family protein with EDD domain
MSGRVGTLQGALASLLSVKPIIRVDDGLLVVSESVRTRGKAIDQLILRLEEVVGTSEPIHLAVIHARADEEGLALRDRIENSFNVQETLYGDLVASLASHGGPGILAVFAYRV